MKKILAAIIAIAVVLSACGITVLAKGGMRKHHRFNPENMESVDFVDENSDGICDNKPEGGKHHNKGDRPVDDVISGDEELSEDISCEKPDRPVKDDCVDEDGDGVCDNKANKPEGGKHHNKGDRPVDDVIGVDETSEDVSVDEDLSEDVSVDEELSEDVSVDEDATEDKPIKEDRPEKKPAKEDCVDEDGDGVCDNKANKPEGGRKHQRKPGLEVAPEDSVQPDVPEVSEESVEII